MYFKLLKEEMLRAERSVGIEPEPTANGFSFLVIEKVLVWKYEEQECAFFMIYK